MDNIFPRTFFLTFRIRWHFGNRMMVGKGEQSKLSTKWKDNWIKPDGRAPIVQLTSPFIEKLKITNLHENIWWLQYGKPPNQNPLQCNRMHVSVLLFQLQRPALEVLWRSAIHQGGHEYSNSHKMSNRHRGFHIQQNSQTPPRYRTSKTSKFIHDHWFHIDSITPNYDTESVPTKHRVAILIFSFYVL